MNFIKVKVLPDGQQQIINLDAVKRIKKECRQDGEIRYELVITGSDIKIDKKEANRIFEIIGVCL